MRGIGKMRSFRCMMVWRYKYPGHSERIFVSRDVDKRLIVSKGIRSSKENCGCHDYNSISKEWREEHCSKVISYER